MNCGSTSANDYGEDELFQAIHFLLYPDATNAGFVNTCGMLDIINTAPYEGPYHHEDYFQTPYDYAGCGWASPNRFIWGPPYQSGGTGWAGNFNGLDYMLFYNLYCICSQLLNNYPQTLSGVYPTQGDSTWSDFYGNNYETFYPLGAIGSPYNFLSCQPINVTNLTVMSDSMGYGIVQNGYGYGPPQNEWAIGDVTAQTSPNSYIDINARSGSVIVYPGSIFTASCMLNCCQPSNNSYIYEGDPGVSNDRKPIKRSDSINYQMSSEFAPKPEYDAILAYPNPFATQTTFEFAVKETTPVTIDIYDTKGQPLASVFVNQTYNQGNYTQTYDGSNLIAGTYLVVMTTKDDKKTIKIVKN